MSTFPFPHLVDKVRFEHIPNTMEARAPSGFREVIDGTGGYYKIGIGVRRLRRLQADQFSAWLDSLAGVFNTFELEIPRYKNSKSNYTGNVTVNGANQVGKSINVDGLPVSQYGILKAGDFIRFANSKKVYRLSEDLDSNGVGQGVLKLHMSIVGLSPADDTNVIFRNVTFNVALQENATMVTDIDVFGYASFDFQLAEVWN